MANPNIVNVTQIYGQTTYLTPANTSNFVLVTNDREAVHCHEWPVELGGRIEWQ